MDKRLSVETLSELQIWIEGKFELIAQAQRTSHEDMTNVRSKLHDLSNEVAKISALNLPAAIADLKKADQEHQNEIARFVQDAAERKGALNTLKALYTVIGGIAGGIFVTLFKLWEVFQR